MTLRNEVLALAFGALVILVTFGDSYLVVEGGTITIGNLDTIFGLALWPVLEVVYVVGSIAVFLLYGWTKSGGTLRFNVVNVLLFALFLAVLALISVDDIYRVFHLPLNLPAAYWEVVSWVYPVCSFIAFFLFGRANQPKKRDLTVQPKPQNQRTV
jgi:hypothetical protein